MPNNSVLQQDIETMLQQVVKLDVRIIGFQPLNRPDSVWVSRLTFVTSSGDTDTVIVKHIPAPNYPISTQKTIPPTHAEEQFIYQFLSGIRPAFDRFPHLLAYQPGLFMLEDLGTDSVKEQPIEVLMESLATTLAQLHGATANLYPRYQTMRQEAGIEADQRMYSHQEQEHLFKIGTGLFYKYCDILGIDVTRCQEIFEQARYAITNPGLFLALIHDDLAAARQIVMVKNQCYLVDFEMAKYGHILMDICKPLVGKFDRKGNTDYFILSHLDFPITFAGCYREKLESISGLSFDDATWNSSLNNALVYSTLVNCGALCCVSPAYKPLGGFMSLFKQLLQRLLILLVDNDNHRDLSPVLEDLTTRIV
ncbi:MAG: phosphotransferase [Okeania sp. SIO3B5]|uniref:phosphotransferase n=1 Tax=Okeania sp. SIO3B5 TaxID=2607811 RepID=UPI0013FF5813|nr:phosphotransferase [Okeania sp. SIO3B5]NEO56481.1 phosphotransferase [Okeania sp. SIO3B5]